MVAEVRTVTLKLTAFPNRGRAIQTGPSVLISSPLRVSLLGAARTRIYTPEQAALVDAEVNTAKIVFKNTTELVDFDCCENPSLVEAQPFYEFSINRWSCQFMNTNR